MCGGTQTSHGATDVLCGGHAAERGVKSKNKRHRRQPGDDPHSLRKRAQRQARADLAKAIAGTTDLVEAGSPSQLSLFGKELERPNLGYYHTESLQDCGRQSETHLSPDYATHLAPFLCDGLVGRRSGHSDDQQTARPQFVRNHHDLSALSTSALRSIAQSDRLVADSPMSEMGRSLPSTAGGSSSPTTTGDGEQEPTKAPPTLRVIDLLKQYAWDTMRRYSHRTARQVESVLAKITLCRTQALGGRLYRCPSCQHQMPVYNSCMDRHCPQCSGSRRVQWVEKTVKLIIKDVNYFHVIFTLPDKINSLALGNRKEVYSLLMQACWQALDDVLRQEQGIQPAAKTVLHTWNQELGVHLHVHALVPGGGPSVDGKRWIETKHPTHKRRKKLYLCDNRTLSQRFRKKFIDGMRRLHRKGLLKFEYQWQGESTTFEPWLKKLGDLDWNVYIEPPPKKTSSADQVVKYLARYMTGGPISDSRLISHEELGAITSFQSSLPSREPTADFTRPRVRLI